MQDEHKEVLQEEISGKLDLVLEATNSLSAVPKRLKSIEDRLERIEGDLSELKGNTKATKAAVTDQTKQVKDHELRISQLEQVETV